jgi:uncharacterized membrane protein
MTLTFDPVWPWSSSEVFTTSGLPVQLTLVVVAVVMLVGPSLWPREDAARQRRFLTRLGVAGLVCLVAIFFLGRGLAKDIPAVLLGTVMLAPVALVGFTIGTYRDVAGATPARVAAILALRLGAFLLCFFLVLRPALAFSDESAVGGRVWIILDFSASMTTADAVDNQPRWDYLHKLLAENQAALEELRKRGIEPEFFAFATDVKEFDLANPGVADGPGTDFGTMLHTLQPRRSIGRPVRAIIVFSDGADNGTTYRALKEAEAWTAPPCPVHTVGLGNSSTVDTRPDVIVTGVSPESRVVGIKSSFTVSVNADAVGFKDRKARLRIYLDGEEARGEEITLTEERGNTFTIKVDAPPRPGDIEIKARIEDAAPGRAGKGLPGELTDKNNEKKTWVTVRKEGVSVLLVDRQRAYEPQSIVDALRQDRERIHLHTVWLRGGKPLDADAPTLFDFAGKQYDAIILGDVTAEQVRAIDPQALTSIEKQVKAGAGLLMMGGYASFGPTWKGTPLELLSPVELGGREQIEPATGIKMVPTDDGLRLFSYVMQLGEKTEDSKRAWARLKELQGINQLTLPPDRTLINVLATSPGGDPILVSKNYGKGRVLAFAGDTTHRWITKPEFQALHARFWRQMISWLGKQDEAAGNVWILPEKRNLPLRTDLDFSVGVRNKHGVEIEGGKFVVTLKTPDGKVFTVPTRPLAGGQEGGKIAVKEHADWLAKPGTYELTVNGSATAVDGEKIEGSATSKFEVEDDEVEQSRRAADHEFLKKLSAAGGGKFNLPTDLPRLLADLGKDAESRRQTNQTYWPGWNTESPQPMRVLTLLLFVAFLAGEWALRRMWGLA